MRYPSVTVKGPSNARHLVSQDMSAQEAVYMDILEVIQSFEGEGITQALLNKIKTAVYHKLVTHVSVGNIDALKWYEDHDIQVVIDEQNPHLVRLNLPKWLEEWLESTDEEV